MNWDWVRNINWGTAIIWCILVLLLSTKITLSFSILMFLLVASIGLSGLIAFLFDLVFKRAIPYLFALIVVMVSLPRKQSLRLLLFKSLEKIIGKDQVKEILEFLGIELSTEQQEIEEQDTEEQETEEQESQEQESEEQENEEQESEEQETEELETEEQESEEQETEEQESEEQESEEQDTEEQESEEQESEEVEELDILEFPEKIKEKVLE